MCGGGNDSLAGRKMKLLHQTLFRTEFCALPKVPPSAGYSGVDLCGMKPGLTRAPTMYTEAITSPQQTPSPTNKMQMRSPRSQREEKQIYLQALVTEKLLEESK